MQDSLVELITQFGVIAAVIVFAIVLLAVCASGTSIGRALLPRSVTDAVSKLLPRAFVTDATANIEGEFQVKVTERGTPRMVHVCRSGGMTTAWTYDADAVFPRSGTFTLTSFQHNLKPGSAIVPETVRARVEIALADTLEPKKFQLAERDVADNWIRVYGALEDEVTLQELGGAFDERDGHAWGTALRTAVQHDHVEEATTFARGSLMLEMVDSRSGRVFWQAVAIADVVVDVSETERERRTRKAISEMLKKSPPKVGTDRRET